MGFPKLGRESFAFTFSHPLNSTYLEKCSIFASAVLPPGSTVATALVSMYCSSSFNRKSGNSVPGSYCSFSGMVTVIGFLNERPLGPNATPPIGSANSGPGTYNSSGIFSAEISVCLCSAPGGTTIFTVPAVNVPPSVSTLNGSPGFTSVPPVPEKNMYTTAITAITPMVESGLIYDLFCRYFIYSLWG